MKNTDNQRLVAVPYLRVSGQGQISGDGFDRQLDTCRKRAEIENYELREAVLEKGVSGTIDAGERPSLSALLEQLASDPECKTIIVERADRLARDLVVSELLLRECRELGIRIIEAESGRELTKDDADDPTSRLIRQILAAVAEFDKNSIVIKLRKARQRKKASGQGGKEGVKPYGSFNGEFDILRIIKELARDGKGPTAIAKTLNARGLPARKGAWSKQSVASILKRQKLTKDR